MSKDKPLNSISSRVTQPRSQGASQAMLYAAGLTEEDMNKPQVGVASIWWEGNPCNMHLNDLAADIRDGVNAADLVGLRFNTIGVSDGISMGTLSDREEAARQVLARSTDGSGVEFESLLAALREGRSYATEVPTGTVAGQRDDALGTTFPYFVQVPENYSAERRYPVRVFLHGGVSRPEWNPRVREWWRAPERVESDEYIGVFPASWGEQRWWQDSQVENLGEILTKLRATYNIDENRVSLIGVSDGGTGAYFVAFTQTTPWASFLPFISHPAVLLNPNVGATAEIFRTNLTNKPLFVVNGENDRLYPTRSVDPFIADFSSGGVEMVYRPLEGVGHEVSWWPSEAGAIDAFIAARPREPHPTCVSWETDQVESGARAHWVVISELAPTTLDVEFDTSQLIGSELPSGRVDAYRQGNEVRLQSRGARRVMLLLSPDAFNLNEAIRVWWNGVLVHDGVPDPNLGVLLRWAARDYDRTMLYGAELTLTAPDTGARDEGQLPPAPGSPTCRGT